MSQPATAPASENPFKLYHYDPTIAGAVFFILCFIGTTGYHTYQLLRMRCWFMLPLIIGGLFEIVGYIGRAMSGQESPNWTLGPYIIQALLLLVAPAMYAATIYMELGRIVVIVEGESRALISREWMTKIFISGDVLSFVLQGGGGGYQASGSLEALNTGAKVIIVGLFVQLIFFGILIVTAAHFYLAISNAPTGRSSSGFPWQKHMAVLFAASILISVRSVFRVVEYLQGFDGYLLSHEAYLYVFDALLMFAVMVLFNIVHPGEIVSLMGGWKMLPDEYDVDRQRMELGLL
ncbi:RTA1 like protein-domain-containing protein [Hypomontagnella monticulosa]|nr:RTA1 like protein-domain-containing protein [Hypomontagnella monticulosa]